MAELLSGGTTVILVSHSIDQIERMCNKVAWLDHGHLRRIGATKEITAEYRRFEKKGRHAGQSHRGISYVREHETETTSALPDLAVQDSVGGMARRLLNPAHLRDLAGRSVKTCGSRGPSSSGAM